MKFIEDDAEKNLEGLNIFGFKLMGQDDVLECDIFREFCMYCFWPRWWNVNIVVYGIKTTNEPHRDKTNKIACAPSEASDQPGHPPSLVRLKKARILSYQLSAQRRLWSDLADVKADLRLHWAHMPFLWFCHDVAQMVARNLNSRWQGWPLIDFLLLVSKEIDLNRFLFLFGFWVIRAVSLW